MILFGVAKLREAAIALISIFLLTTPAWAVSHANKLSMPIAVPYAQCGDETSITNCAGTYAPLSPWVFEQGTIEVAASGVGLRLDNIKLRDGYVCTDVGGGPSACLCWDDNNTNYCSSNSVCAPDGCGPNADVSNNNYFKVEIWAQAYATGGILCGSGGLCPHLEREGCHTTVYFDVKDVSGNRNEDVDQSVSLQWGGVGCSGLGPDAPEIRHIRVYDKWDNLVGVGGYKP